MKFAAPDPSQSGADELVAAADAAAAPLSQLGCRSRRSQSLGRPMSSSSSTRRASARVRDRWTSSRSSASGPSSPASQSTWTRVGRRRRSGRARILDVLERFMNLMLKCPRAMPRLWTPPFHGLEPKGWKLVYIIIGQKIRRPVYRDRQCDGRRRDAEFAQAKILPTMNCMYEYIHNIYNNIGSYLSFGLGSMGSGQVHFPAGEMCAS